MRSSTRLFLILFCIAFVTSCASAKTVDVTGSGDNDQTKINSAISSASAGDVVDVHGTCVISAPIEMKDGVKLSGDGYTKTTIKAESPSDFDSTAMILLDGISNAEVSGFTLNGGEKSTSAQHENGGSSANPCGMKVYGDATKDKIHDIYFTLLDGDGIKAGTSPSSYIDVYNCKFNMAGHDGIQNWYGQNWHIYNCYFNVFVNCGIRFANTIDNTIDHCTIVAPNNSGWCGIEIEGQTSGLDISNCVIKDIHGSTGSYGITTVSASGNAKVQNCVFSDCTGGNIHTSGLDVTTSD
jgi:Right handed beta helix region